MTPKMERLLRRLDAAAAKHDHEGFQFLELRIYGEAAPRASSRQEAESILPPGVRQALTEAKHRLGNTVLPYARSE